MRSTLATFTFLFLASPTFAQADMPRASDPRLIVTQFAASPDIVHPIACDFDAKGRLLVIESHTHFAPPGYQGPKFDRIRMCDPRLAPGAGNRFTTFFEGTRHTMDLAVHPDGSVYVATRNEILRLRDTKGTGVADEKTRIVFLDTKGDYPHNGLSGLCFDSKGDLIFGMGENLGAAYKLIGSDGTTFAGQGDGGHIFHCSADGKKLRRIATGFWNPFGNCRDIYGRLFCVDNDPDQSPPCRMLHVVEGGDYGFTFRYGRSGKHPFQSWHGQLPGTLPMMTGVGEAPCEILSYESDGLPAEYRGQLLVTSWADHRVERYKVVPHGASFKGERLPFVQGSKDFRPTGMCVAPDGSLFVADWVLSNYTLHGKGAIWHVRWKDAPKVERPSDPKKAIFSMHRPLREAAAQKLASNDDVRSFLTAQIKKDALVRTASAVLTALVDGGSVTAPQLIDIAKSKSHVGIRELAVRELVARHELKADVRIDTLPARLRALAIERMKLLGKELDVDDAETLLRALTNTDPFLRHAAIRHVGQSGAVQRFLNVQRVKDTDLHIAAILAERHYQGVNSPGSRVKLYLNDRDETVRFLAVKWIADEKLADYRKHIEKALTDPKLSVRMYMAYATALARLDGQEVSETKLADYFVKRLDDDKTPPALRVQLLRQVPATHKGLTIDLLAKLVKTDDAALKLEAVRALVEHPSIKRHEPLLAVFRNPKLGTHLQALALLGLMDRRPEEHIPEIMPDVTDPKSPLHADAERALIGFELKPGKPFARPPVKDRPAAKDLDAWLKRLEGPADGDAGARIFFHPKLGGCSKCHRIDGRGKDVGPDLSGIGRTDRRHILESILQPSSTVAPHYQVWHLETSGGKTQSGMLLHTQLDEYTYLDARGGQFKLRTGDIVETRAVAISIMPDGLVDTMTDQEMRDLLAYLGTRN